MKKRRTWKQFIMKCPYGNVCECGLSFLCYHEDNEAGDCNKKECPIWKKRKNK